ncbi:MAG: cytochrome c3 family protein [Caldilineaceae bacterium]|nr:cytochrome c3 family protein [Caldilineaceae bacterium]
MIKRLLFVLVFVPCLLWVVHERATAAPLVQTPDSACILCHVGNDEEITLPSGEVLAVDVAPAVLDESVHGAHLSESVYCTDCHQDRQRYRYPHEPIAVQSLAEFAAAVSQNCEDCHTPLELHNPGHLLAADTANLPNCVDCHGGHNVAPAELMAAEPVATCQSCHGDFVDPQLASMHQEVVANFGPEQTCQTCHADTPPPTADTTCKTCHALLSEPVALPSGETFNPHVDPKTIHDSVHGPQELNGEPYGPLQCTACHSAMRNTTFPHEPLTVETRRELTLQSTEFCADCHENIVAQHADSMHAVALAEGNLDAATCIDCHGSHDIQPPNEPRERISQTCGNCHGEVEEQYVTSVHGEALLGEHNPDVPVCTNCHGVHQIPDPTTATFRINSPQMCGECHADNEMMAKYDISTDVFETYVADFHGTTVTLFEQQSPEEETNKAVCYDCHGIHDIRPATDEHSSVIKQNLLTTCRECHPDATENFPDSWTSHFKPSLEHNPVVYLVDLFYDFLIPVVVGGFALFIGSDVFRRSWNRRRAGRGKHE